MKKLSELGKWVPLEATADMRESGPLIEGVPPVTTSQADAVYDAMLSAAPSTPTEALERVVEALNQIEGQAVCVNMDGDAGNERMLCEIAIKARDALAALEAALKGENDG